MHERNSAGAGSRGDAILISRVFSALVRAHTARESSRDNKFREVRRATGARATVVRIRAHPHETLALGLRVFADPSSRVDVKSRPRAQVRGLAAEPAANHGLGTAEAPSGSVSHSAAARPK